MGERRRAEWCQRGHFGGLFLNLVVLPGMSLLFGSSGVPVSAVRVIWGGDWIRQAADAGKEQGARSLWKEAGEGGSPIKVRGWVGALGWSQRGVRSPQPTLREGEEQLCVHCRGNGQDDL